jgi:hypothetical protein
VAAVQNKSKGGLLSVNADPSLQETLREAALWERLRMSLPFSVAEVRTPADVTLRYLGVKLG